MASIASTYARAFADVVFDVHLDAGRAIAGLRRIASLFGESLDLRRVWENPAVPADQKRNCWTRS
jgi:F0F1-type ATP synthase delta subunit